MVNPIQEVKELCKKLSEKNQHTLLRHAQVALIAENSARGTSPSSDVTDTKTQDKKTGER